MRARFQLVRHAHGDGEGQWDTVGTVLTWQEMPPAWHGWGRGPVSLAALRAHTSHAAAPARAAAWQIGSNQGRNGVFSRHTNSSPASTARPRRTGARGANAVPEGSPKPPPSTQSLGSAVSGVPEEGAFKSGEERCSSRLSAATTPHAMTKGQRRCCQAAPGPHCSPQAVGAVISAS